MPRKLRELRSDLRRAGFAIARQKGSHEQWTHPLLGSQVITLVGADGDDARPYQESEIRRALRAAEAARKGKLP